jgi:ABC-type transporter Mla MlaB component
LSFYVKFVQLAPKKKKSIPKGNDVEDPWQLAKLLFARLEAVEPVDEAALVRLADSQAQAIVNELSEKLRVVPERLNTLSSVSVEKKDSTAAALSWRSCARI